MGSVLSEDDYKKQTSALYALMGEFVVEFEQICLAMKMGITQLSGIYGLSNQQLMNSVLAEYTAHPLLKVYHSTFIEVKWSNDEIKTNLNEVHRRMTKLIELRNDYVHGTMFVGYGNGTETEITSAGGFKLKNSKPGVKITRLTLDENTFRPIIDECRSLADLVRKTSSMVFLQYLDLNGIS